MEFTLERIIKKLELNESAVSTIIGGIALLIVTVLFVGYFKDYKTTQVQPTPQITSGETTNLESETILETGQTSSTATTRYQVKPNETLWSIAQAQYNNGYKWKDIAQANQLANPDIISEGMILDIPRASDIGITPDPSISQVPETHSETNVDNQTSDNTSATYTVTANDSLWKIAISNYNDGYRWTEIWQLNQDQISNPNILPVGLVLKMPSK